MRTILFVLLFTVQATAGTVKLTWDMFPYDVYGNVVSLTKFRVYFGDTADVTDGLIELGPPMPLPWRANPDGSDRYSKTLTNASWFPGRLVCFAVSAFSGSLESEKSNVICRQMLGNPYKPTLVDLTEKP